MKRNGLPRKSGSDSESDCGVGLGLGGCRGVFGRGSFPPLADMRMDRALSARWRGQDSTISIPLDLGKLDEGVSLSPLRLGIASGITMGNRNEKWRSGGGVK